MAKSIKVTPKKRGRPATGRDPHVTARLPVDLVAEIEAWASMNQVSRSQAIRSLIEQALAAQPKAKKGKL